MPKLPETIGELQKFAELVREDQNKRIVRLLEDSFYPLDYPRWQADELMDEIFRLIKGKE
jgi:hypothetical protein